MSANHPGALVIGICPVCKDWALLETDRKFIDATHSLDVQCSGCGAVSHMALYVNMLWNCHKACVYGMARKQSGPLVGDASDSSE